MRYIQKTERRGLRDLQDLKDLRELTGHPILGDRPKIRRALRNLARLAEEHR